jgi:hypothetical protein
MAMAGANKGNGRYKSKKPLELGTPNGFTLTIIYRMI